MTAAQCSTTHLKLLTYAGSNNLAGMDDPQGRASANVSILQYYERLSASLFRDYEITHIASTLFSNVISMRPLAETLFKAAVGIGNVEIVKRILSWPESSLNVNDVVIIEDSSGVPFTALEFAAHCQNLPLVELLIDNGADLNGYRPRSYSNAVRMIEQEPSMEGRSIAAEAQVRGSLECALCPRLPNDEWWRPPDYDPHLISHLVEHGARVQPMKNGRPCEYLLHQMLLPKHGCTVDLLVSRLINSANQHSWMDSGFFHVAFDNLEQAVLHRLLDYMCSWTCDFGHCDQPSGGMPPRFQFCTPGLAWKSPLQFPLKAQRPLTTRTRLEFIVDICAARGHLELVRQLLDLGVSCSSETLSVAIAAHQVEVAQYLMRQPHVDPHGYSSLLKSTPFAEAVYLRNETLLISFPSSAASLNFESYRAVVRAAAAIGDLERVHALLDSEKPSHINTTQRQQVANIALLEACHEKRTGVVRYLLEADACASNNRVTFDDSTFFSESALGMAIQNKDLASIEALIDHGASGGLDFYQMTAVQCATAAGDALVVKMLIAAGYSSRGAFDVAVEHSHMQLARELLAMGALVGLRGLRGAVVAQDLDMVELILAHDPSLVDVARLDDAVKSGNERITNVLYNRIVKDGLHYDQGQKAWILETLVRYGKLELLRPFLPANKVCMHPFRIELDWLVRPLLAAINSNESVAFEIARAVLEAGANKNTLCARYESEASFASRSDRHVPQKSADVRVVTSALLEAICLGKKDLVELLVDFGADVNMPAKKGCRKTPLQQAAETGFYGIVEMLILHGVDVNTPPAVRYGATALQLAAKQGYIGLAELLIERGANICAPGAVVGGQTAFESAAEWGRFDMINYLASRAKIPDDELRNAQKLAQANGHGAVVKTIECMMLHRHDRPRDMGSCSTIPGAHEATLQGMRSFEMPGDMITVSNNKQLGASKFLCDVVRRPRPEDTTQVNQKTPTELPDGPTVRPWEQSSSDMHPSFESPDICYVSVDSRQDPSTSLASDMSQHAESLSINGEIIELGGSSTQHVCRKCQTQFCNASALSRHRRTKHATSSHRQKFSCPQCDRSFTRKDLCDRHQAAHSKNLQMYAPCPRCDWPHRKDYLKKHILICRGKVAIQVVDG